GAVGKEPGLGAGSAWPTAAIASAAAGANRTARVRGQIRRGRARRWRASGPIGWCDIGDLLPRFGLVGGTWGWIAPVGSGLCSRFCRRFLEPPRQSRVFLVFLV